MTIRMYWVCLIIFALLTGAAGLYWSAQAWWLWFLGSSPIIGSMVGHAVHKNEEEQIRKRTANDQSEFLVICLLVVAVIVGILMFAASAEVHWVLMGFLGLITAIVFAVLPVLGPVTILSQTWRRS